MVVIIVAPQVILSIAGRDWLWAKASAREMRALGFSRSQWSMSHAFFANMGGFVLDIKGENRKEPVGEDQGGTEKSGESLQRDGPRRNPPNERPICATELAMLVREPYSIAIPSVTREDL